MKIFFVFIVLLLSSGLGFYAGSLYFPQPQGDRNEESNAKINRLISSLFSDLSSEQLSTQNLEEMIAEYKLLFDETKKRKEIEEKKVKKLTNDLKIKVSELERRAEIISTLKKKNQTLESATSQNEKGQSEEIKKLMQKHSLEIKKIKKDVLQIKLKAYAEGYETGKEQTKAELLGTELLGR